MSDERGETFDDFDETNGLVPGLDGDDSKDGEDGGGDTQGHGVFGDLVEDVTTGFADRDAPHEERD